MKGELLLINSHAINRAAKKLHEHKMNNLDRNGMIVVIAAI